MWSPELEDDQAELVNGDTAEMTTDGEEVVKKAKKKKSVSQSIKPLDRKWACPRPCSLPVCAPEAYSGLTTPQEAEGGRVAAPRGPGR